MHDSVWKYFPSFSDELKAKYKSQYAKHKIHRVNSNHKIVLKDMNVEEFAVELKLVDIERPVGTMRGELRRRNERSEGMRCSNVMMSDIIDEDKRIVFIRGLPGAGKSVLVKQMTYKWADGELFQQFDLCITFECRELNYFMQNEGKHVKKHKKFAEFVKSRFNYFEFKSKSNVLFIVDGLEELKDIFDHTDDSIIWQLLDVKMPHFSRAKLIITGMPHVENILFCQNKDTRGIRIVEIDGVREKQIEEYVKKFASPDDELVEKINKAIDSSKSNLKKINYPQILNAFCCMASISDELKVHNETELYCWSFYLLLKQHAEKDGTTDKEIPEIFKEYSEDVLALSRICHKLLNKNTNIIEGESEFCDIGKGNEFLEGLFVDVSDDFHTKKQFKHLTLMEFLSAVYVCTIENPTEIIKDILEKRLDQVLLFNCQLIAGLMYDGIIKEMFKNAANLKEVNCENFFHLVLTLVRKCVADEYEAESFKLSIDVIMCLMNKDVIKKQFILSIVNQLNFRDVTYSSNKLIEMMKGLLNDFGCGDGELKRAFENIYFQFFVVTEVNCLKFAKFLASVDWISLDGCRATITTSVKYIKFSISECRNLSRVSILNCELQDADLKEEITECPKLEELQIWDCDVSEQSFLHICKWIINVRQVELSRTRGMEGEWWSRMLEAIVRAKENNHADVALTMLNIERCPLMNDEMKNKVITFILIHNCHNFILLYNWFTIRKVIC